VQVVQARAGTGSTEAYDAFQRARQLVTDAERLVAAGNAQAASAELRRADSAFAHVSSLDPEWAMPVVEHGWVSYRQSRLLQVFDRPAYARWIEEGLVRAERAVSMAPRDADALELRGTLRYWRWLLNLVPAGTTSAQALAEAESDLNAAVEVNANQASAWNSLSHLRFAKSQTSSGKLAALKAYEADPYLQNVNLTLWRLFQGSLDLGDAPEAQKWCGEGGERFPNDYRFAECRLWLLTLRGADKPTPAAIWSALDAFVKASPSQQQEFHRLKAGMIASIALLRAGMPDSARAVATRSRGTSEIDPPRELAYLEAIMRAQVGDRDEAFRLLNLYLATNPQQRGSAGQEESWWFEELYADPRWAALWRA
jgi:tetratricopeptide (TPR) repeat protein